MSASTPARPAIHHRKSCGLAIGLPRQTHSYLQRGMRSSEIFRCRLREEKKGCFTGHGNGAFILQASFPRAVA